MKGTSEMNASQQNEFTYSCLIVVVGAILILIAIASWGIGG